MKKDHVARRGLFSILLNSLTACGGIFGSALWAVLARIDDLDKVDDWRGGIKVPRQFCRGLKLDKAYAPHTGRCLRRLLKSI